MDGANLKKVCFLFLPLLWRGGSCFFSLSFGEEALVFSPSPLERRLLFFLPLLWRGTKGEVKLALVT
jgi:hypothetical protein